MAGSGWYTALASPPYRFVDEQAHTGYELELQAGRLPTIDTPIDAAHGGQALRDRLRIEPERRRDVWVANNPPLPYALAMPAAATARAFGVAGGPLLGMRLVNVAAMAASVAVIARLATSLAGGDRRVGLVAAGLFAALPHVGFIAGTGGTDGFALLCSVVVLDVLVTICREGATRRRLAWLGAWVGIGAATRPMTAVLVAACAAAAFGVVTWRWWRDRRADRSEETGTAPAVGLGWTAAWLAVPTAVLSGWWYLRNTAEYGDPTASDRIFEKFLREPHGTLGDALTRPSLWRKTVQTTFFRRLETYLPGDGARFWPLLKWSLLAALLVAVVLVVRDQWSPRPRTSALSWALAGGVVVLVTVLIGQHFAGGGEVHARYAFPAMAVVVAAVALALVRIGTAWAGLAATAALVAVQVRQVDNANAYLTANPTPGSSEALVTPIGPEWARMAGPGLMAVGAVLLVVGVLWSRPVSPEAAAAGAARTGPPAPPP